MGLVVNNRYSFYVASVLTIALFLWCFLSFYPFLVMKELRGNFSKRDAKTLVHRFG